MFKARLTFQDKEASLMTMIMTPIVTHQKLISQARFLGQSSLSQQLAFCWEHGSLRLCPEMAGKTHFEGALPWNGFLKFQAFRSPWDKVVPQHGGPVGRWQLVPLGSQKSGKRTEGAGDHRLGTCATAPAAACRRYHLFRFCAWPLWLPLYSLWYGLFHSLG